jgi:hypothetical protein
MLTMRTHLLSLLCLLTIGGWPAYAVGAQGGPGGDASSTKENTLASPQWPVGAYTLRLSPLNSPPLNDPPRALIWRRDETTLWISVLHAAWGGEVWAVKQSGQGTSDRLEPLDPKMPTVVLEDGNSMYFSGPSLPTQNLWVDQNILSANVFTQTAPEWVQKALHSLEKAKFLELKESDDKLLFTGKISFTFSGPVLMVNDETDKTCERAPYTLGGWGQGFSQEIKPGTFSLLAFKFKNKTADDCTQVLSLAEAASKPQAGFLVLVGSNGAVEALLVITVSLDIYVREGVTVDYKFKRRVDNLLSSMFRR